MGCGPPGLQVVVGVAVRVSVAMTKVSMVVRVSTSDVIVSTDTCVIVMVDAASVMSSVIVETAGVKVTVYGEEVSCILLWLRILC